MLLPSFVPQGSHGCTTTARQGLLCGTLRVGLLCMGYPPLSPPRPIPSLPSFQVQVTELQGMVDSLTARNAQLQEDVDLSDAGPLRQFMETTSLELRNAVAKLKALRQERDVAVAEKSQLHVELSELKVKEARSPVPQVSPVLSVSSLWRAFACLEVSMRLALRVAFSLCYVDSCCLRPSKTRAAPWRQALKQSSP